MFKLYRSYPHYVRNFGGIVNILNLKSSSTVKRSLYTGTSSWSNQLSEDVKGREGAVTIGSKVKQAGKDASYIGVLLIGFGVTGALIWYIASELLFGFSPNAVYTKAFKHVKKHYLVAEEIGDGMKGYGEETSRGRRRHVNHQAYVVDGVNYMRVQFYISGNKRKGTVHADAMETSRGNFEFRYIYVELQGFPPSEPIIVLDNR